MLMEMRITMRKEITFGERKEMSGSGITKKIKKLMKEAIEVSIIQMF